MAAVLALYAASAAAPPPPPPPLVCESWCAGHDVDDWEVKCGWAACNGCGPCVPSDVSDASSYIVTLGDSWAQGGASSLGVSCGGSVVANEGKGGSKAYQWSNASTYCSVPDSIAGRNFTHVWLSIGGNDFKEGWCSTSETFLDTLEANIVATIELVREELPGVPILMTGYAIPAAPINEDVCALPSELEPLQLTIQRACTATNATFIDVAETLGGSFEMETSSSWTYFADSQHPNDLGYQTIFSMPEIQAFFGCEATVQMTDDFSCACPDGYEYDGEKAYNNAYSCDEIASTYAAQLKSDWCCETCEDLIHTANMAGFAWAVDELTAECCVSTGRLASC